MIAQGGERMKKRRTECGGRGRLVLACVRIGSNFVLVLVSGRASVVDLLLLAASKQARVDASALHFLSTCCVTGSDSLWY